MLVILGGHVSGDGEDIRTFKHESILSCFSTLNSNDKKVFDELIFIIRYYPRSDNTILDKAKDDLMALCTNFYAPLLQISQDETLPDFIRQAAKDNLDSAALNYIHTKNISTVPNVFRTNKDVMMLDTQRLISISQDGEFSETVQEVARQYIDPCAMVEISYYKKNEDFKSLIDIYTNRNFSESVREAALSDGVDNMIFNYVFNNYDKTVSKIAKVKWLNPTGGDFHFENFLEDLAEILSPLPENINESLAKRIIEEINFTTFQLQGLMSNSFPISMREASGFKLCDLLIKKEIMGLESIFHSSLYHFPERVLEDIALKLISTSDIGFTNLVIKLRDSEKSNNTVRTAAKLKLSEMAMEMAQKRGLVSRSNPLAGDGVITDQSSFNKGSTPNQSLSKTTRAIA